MTNDQDYREFQEMIFTELDCLEWKADRPLVEVVLKLSEEQIRIAAARGIRCERECRLRIPEERLLAIEPDRTKWPDTLRQVFERGLHIREDQIRRSAKRHDAE
jgi:hypothetical protein